MRVITIDEMDKDGKFPCPNCGAIIDPDTEDYDDYVVFPLTDIPTFVKIRHKCGEEIKIMLPEGIAQ